VFWASLSLSPLCDINDRSIGLIAYLTDITERKMAEERIHHLAYYDALTNLPNRTLLTKLVDQALMVAQRNKAHGCVLFIDLNRFKLINDTLGRKIGDSWSKWRAASAPCCATRTWWRAWAATSSRSACSTSASTSRPAWWRKSCSPR
jgi:hypothetical protein